MAKSNFSLVNTILFILNAVVVIALLLAYLANYLNPKIYFMPAIFGLFYPYLLLANLLFVVVWLFRVRKYCLLSLLAILLGFNSFQRFYQFKANGIAEEENKNLIKTMSYNVHIFGLYDNENTQDEILDFLKKEKPDIACLQEYCQNISQKPNLAITTRIKENIGAKDYYIYTPLSRDKYQFGLAIFSKFPIVNKGTIPFKDAKTNQAVFADLKINNDTVRIYNIHFQSIGFGKEDYLFAQQATSDLTNNEWKKGSMRILKKIKTGFAKRSAQVDTISEHIKLSPYKTIVCGDFNDTPWSYTYKQINNLLKDAFVNSGKGFGNTLVINKLLSYRIDYIFHDKSFQSYGFTTEKLNASDHFPVYTHVRVQGEEVTR